MVYEGYSSSGRSQVESEVFMPVAYIARYIVRFIGKTSILVGAAILVGVIASVAVEHLIGPDAKHLAGIIGAIVSLFMLLGALLIVIERGSQNDDQEVSEEETTP